MSFDSKKISTYSSVTDTGVEFIFNLRNNGIEQWKKDEIRLFCTYGFALNQNSSLKEDVLPNKEIEIKLFAKLFPENIGENKTVWKLGKAGFPFGEAIIMKTIFNGSTKKNPSAFLDNESNKKRASSNFAVSNLEIAIPKSECLNGYNIIVKCNENDTDILTLVYINSENCFWKENTVLVIFDCKNNEITVMKLDPGKHKLVKGEKHSFDIKLNGNYNFPLTISFGIYDKKIGKMKKICQDVIIENEIKKKNREISDFTKNLNCSLFDAPGKYVVKIKAENIAIDLEESYEKVFSFIQNNNLQDKSEYEIKMKFKKNN